MCERRFPTIIQTRGLARSIYCTACLHAQDTTHFFCVLRVDAVLQVNSYVGALNYCPVPYLERLLQAVPLNDVALRHRSALSPVA